MIFYDADIKIPLGKNVRITLADDGEYHICKVRSIINPGLYFFKDDSKFEYSWTEHGFLHNFHYRRIINGDKRYIKLMMVGKLGRITPI